MYKVKVIADTLFGSIRATTFELEYPRYIHAELMTHRVFSRNAASSRAIPVSAVIAQVRDNTVMPLWTYNESGMQGKAITSGGKIQRLNAIWLASATSAMAAAELLHKEGAHKQNINRVLEPYQFIKVVLTSTQFVNFFNLRMHEDAQPEIAHLAMMMYANYSESDPRVATGSAGDTNAIGAWHLPYAESLLELGNAKKVSASCSAQVSYRKSDDSLAKAELVFDKLVGGVPLHASPFEHQCTWGNPNSRGNLPGLHQYRQDIETAL